MPSLKLQQNQKNIYFIILIDLCSLPDRQDFE